jgi:predicted RNA binding protein YcfA (HicA-like mRNA interferase family)
MTVPKLLPASPSKVEKFLFRLGYSVIKKRGKGGHRIYKKEGSPGLIIIPFHSREVAKGTLEDRILKALSLNENIEKEKLIELLDDF